MTALTEARKTQRKLSCYDMTHERTIASSVTVYAGALVAVNTSDEIVLAGASGSRTLGRACTGGTAGDSIRVEQGIFAWVNSSITAAAVGLPCFAEDDQTVSLDDTKPFAGYVYQYESSSKIWVLTHCAQMFAPLPRPVGDLTAGDTFYWNGTTTARLAIGTAGQVMEVNAGATAPEWDADD